VREGIPASLHSDGVEQQKSEKVKFHKFVKEATGTDESLAESSGNPRIKWLKRRSPMIVLIPDCLARVK
jgi:hypothetical protein